MLRFVLPTLVTCAVATGICAQERSVITLPISVEIGELEAYANKQLPEKLVDDPSKRHICVEAERACTKIPEFRGFKIYSRMECVDITPRISCQVNQRAWREGRLELTGSGDALTARLSLRGTATVAGRGEIGQHIQETAHGAATFTVIARPAIRPDWSLDLPFEYQIAWNQRPKAELFGFIKVTFGSAAEKELRAAIDEFRAKTLPAELARIDLRAQVVPVWQELQKPIEIALPSDGMLWLHFEPDAVGVTPLRADEGRLTTAVSIGGNLWITDTSARPSGAGQPTEQPPDLTPVPGNGISVAVPVRIGLATLGAELTAALPISKPFDIGSISGNARVTDAEFEANDGRLTMRLKTQIDMNNPAAGFDGVLLLSGVPVWDQETRELRLEAPELRAEGGGLTGSLLNALSSTGILEDILAQVSSISLSDQIDGLGPAIDAALAEGLPEGMEAKVDLTLSAESLRLDGEVLTLTVRASGAGSITGLALR